MAIATLIDRPWIELISLPDELLLHILSFLDIPDLLSTSRTSHHLRTLCLDPILHNNRKRHSIDRLSNSLSLPQRPSISSLSPPANTIILKNTHVLARSLSRKLISIRLQRNLSRRPEVSVLIEKNVLPMECCGRDEDGKKVWLGGKGMVSPGLVEMRRKVEREKVKDGLRVGIERKWEVVERQRRRGWLEDERKDVRELIRRFTVKAGWKDDTNWRNINEETSNEVVVSKSRPKPWTWVEKRTKWRDVPTRSHVLGLKKFWEGLANGAQTLKG